MRQPFLRLVRRFYRLVFRFRLLRSSLHILEQVMRFIRTQPFVEKRQIDLFLFGKVNLDQSVQAIQNAPQVFCQGSRKLPPANLLTQDSQVPSETPDLNMIAAHGRRCFGRTQHFGNQRVERAIFGFSVRNQMMGEEMVDLVQLMLKSLSRDVANHVGNHTNVFDVRQ